MSKISKKGNYSKIIFFFSKISPNTSLIIPFQLTQFSSFYLKYFLRYGIYKISFRFFQRAVILLGEIIPPQKNTHLLFFHEESIHEVSRRYLIPEYHNCKISVSKILKKGNNSKISYDFFLQIFVKYSIYHPLSADTSFKFLAIILFEIRHLQNFIPLFVKGP